MAERALAGGRDRGAVLVDGTVRRPVRPWTASVHHLLAFLAEAGLRGAPRPLGVDDEGREILTHLPGRTVGVQRPWPAWTHDDAALVDVGRWLRDYHRVVGGYVPPPGATWRQGGTWRPGLVIGHGDPAPYNAVWDDDGLVGLIDWDDAGPVEPADDLAWVAFSWTPLHARAVVAEEGFTDFSRRRERLGVLLDAYGWTGTLEEVLDRVAARLDAQVRAMREVAASGDPAYRQMLRRGQDRLLETARRELADLRG